MFFYLSVLCELLAIDEIDRFDALDETDPLRAVVIDDVSEWDLLPLLLLLVSLAGVFSLGKNTM